MNFLTGKIKNWSVEQRRDQLYIAGEVYNHPLANDGDSIFTSAIVGASMDGRAVITQSGSIYALCGDPDPVFWVACPSNNVDIWLTEVFKEEMK